MIKSERNPPWPWVGSSYRSSRHVHRRARIQRLDHSLEGGGDVDQLAGRDQERGAARDGIGEGFRQGAQGIDRCECMLHCWRTNVAGPQICLAARFGVAFSTEYVNTPER